MAAGSELRILSLIASATEIVCALGFRDQLVGRSHECDFPPDVRTLPQATRPRFDVSASSRDIDEQVTRLVENARALDALGVYAVLPEVLRAVRPTHIITQTQCEVCAVSQRDVVAAVAGIAGCSAEIVSLQPNALADIWEDLSLTAAALGDPAAGAALAAAMKRRMQAVADAASALPARPTVAAIEWVDPLMAVGNWMPELIEMAGGRCLLGEAGRHSPRMDFRDLADADPDVIVICPCGFDLDRTLEDVRILAARPEWRSLRAVREGRAYAADGNQYFNRPGPRLADTTEVLAEMLHPDRFDFGYRGSAWVAAGGNG